jgi:hypothetical protein
MIYPVFPLYSKKTKMYIGVFILLAVIQGIQVLYAFKNGNLIFSVIYLLCFLGCLFVIWISIGKVRKQTPRIEIRKGHIFIKEEIFSPAKIIRWDEIKHIRISSLALTISLEDRRKKYFYFKFDLTRLEELKKLIKLYAEEFEISAEI